MVVPSHKWFPQSLAERAAWFQNFASEFENLGTGLGFTAPEIADVTADNISVQQLAQWAVTVDSFSKGMTAFRREVLEGNDGDPPASLPTPPDFSDATIVNPGIFERLDKLVKRIRVAPNYSEEEGQQLGIIGPKSDPIAPGTHPPVLKLTALPANVVNVDFKRGSSDGIQVQTQLDNSGTWTTVGTYFKSPAAVTIPEGPNGLPRSVQVRARYVDGNTPVGDYSAVETISTIP